MLRVIRYLLFCCSILFFGYGFIENNFNIMLNAILLLWINNILYCLDNISDRIVMFFFSISFFTFLLGKYLFEMLDGVRWWDIFPENVMVYTLLSIYISLLFIFIGSFLFEFLIKVARNTYNTKVSKEDLSDNTDLKNNIRKISRFMFYITFLFALLVSIEKALYVQSNGYIALYSDFSSRLPFWVRKIAETNIIFLFIYLSTFPKKNESKTILFLYIIYLFLTLLSGVRGTFVSGLFVLMIYAIYRDKRYREIDVKWMGMKEKVSITFGAPFLIIFLSVYNFIRSKIPVSEFSFFQEIVNFFKTQGGSVNVISLGKLYESQLPPTNQNYTFGSIINYFTRGTIARLFTNLSPLKGNTVEMALYGNNFGATITYLVIPEYYLSGGGLGTQYIAEVYADFGYIGVILFNFVLGCLLSWIPCVLFKKWWMFVLGMSICFYFIIPMPRDSATTFIGAFLSLTTWLPILFTFFLARLEIKRKITVKAVE